MLYHSTYDSPVGPLTLLANDDNLLELSFAHEHYPSLWADQPRATTDQQTVIALTRAWLDRYFTGKRPDHRDLPLQFTGSTFRRQVWHELQTIPYGRVASYLQIARRLNPRLAAQAVGGAVGHNQLCIVVPCHRVVASHGLGGFGGGEDTKIWLLHHEGVDLDALPYVPS